MTPPSQKKHSHAGGDQRGGFQQLHYSKHYIGCISILQGEVNKKSPYVRIGSSLASCCKLTRIIPTRLWSASIPKSKHSTRHHQAEPGKWFHAQYLPRNGRCQGSKPSLGETEAGKVVADSLKQIARWNKGKDLQAAHDILSRPYDVKFFEEFKWKRIPLQHRIRLQRSGRWIMRTALVSSAIVTTVRTMGPGVAVVMLKPAFEITIDYQREDEKRKQVKLEHDFTQKNNQINPQWLQDSKA